MYTQKNYEKYSLKHQLNWFKKNFFVFINFSKNFRKFIRIENLSYKIP